MTRSNPIRRFTEAWLREREQLRRTIEVVRLGLRGLIRSQLPRMAAALSYRTIFSLIPVLVVGVVIMGAFLSDTELRSQVDRLISYIGLDQIVIIDDAVEAGPVGPADPAEPTPEVEPEGPSGRLDEWITSLVERVSSLPFRAIGFVGVLVLLYGAIAMLVELERAFNQIYGAANGRSWVKRVTTYWTTLTLGVVFLLATFSVGDMAGNWVASIGRAEDEAGGWFSRGAVQLSVNIAINTALLLLAYSTVPNTKVHIRPALGGAFFAGMGWELGKIAFTQYIRYAVGGLEQLYGVLALLPMFLFWVYITWIIVLFGLQVSYALQNFSRRREELTGQETGLVDPAVILTICRLAADRFERGKTIEPDEIEESIGLQPAMTEKFFEALVRAGFMHQTETPEANTAYVLARPPGSIAVTDLLKVARQIRSGGVRGGSPSADEALDRTLAGVVLADLQEIPESPDSAHSPAPSRESGLD